MLRSSARRCGSIAAASSAGRRSSTCPLRGVLECQAAFPYKRLSDAGRSGMYERFFGLGDAPFRLTPDPRSRFLSSKHAEALAHLRLGLKESSGFVCIAGDVGTGKTALLRAFLAELGPEVKAAYIISPALSTLELLQRINREFGLPGTSTSQMELVDTLNAHLLAQHQAGRVSVVVVDEAQAFSMDLLEQLRLLSNLETATEKLLRVVLVGQPQLRTLLLDPAMAQLNQRITLRWHMGPLRYRETVAYVRHRLSIASEGRAARPAEVVARAAPEPPAISPPAAEPTPAPAPPAANAEPAPAPAAVAEPGPAPPLPLPSPVADLERRLRALGPDSSAHSALDAVLAAWHARPLGDDESRVTDDVERIAWRRGLEDLRLTGNRSTLAVLDLPALLELRVPHASGSCFATLTALDERRERGEAGAARVRYS